MIKLDVGIAREELCEKEELFIQLMNFFSSLVESEGMGSKYPLIFNNLYQGRIGKQYADEAYKEFESLKIELQNIPMTVDKLKNLQMFSDKYFLSAVNNLDFYLDKQAKNAYELFITSGMRENFIDVLQYSTVRSKKFDADIEIGYSPI